MRGLRSFVALLVILIGLGAYLYFVESKRTPGDEAEKREKVFTVEADAIDEVTITSEAGESTTLRKSGEAWQMVAPVAAPADAAEISGITTNLSTIEEQRLIDENPANLEEFGLAKPRIEETFKSGGQEHRLQIGSKTPTGSDLYAKTGAQSKVFLVASFLESTFNRSTFDLRDKRALAFDRDTADSLEIVTADRTIRFAKSNNTWQIAQPASTRADAAAIEGLVARVNSLQMKKLEADDAADLKRFGLDTPAATLRIGSGSSQASLLIGSAAGEGEVYAKDASRPAVFTIESTFLEDLKKDAGEYRQKDLFDARAFNTTRLEVVRGAETWVFEKTKAEAGGEEKWRQTTPAAKDADAANVSSLLSALTSARAESFVPAAAAGAQPDAVFTLTFDEGKQERVTFARAGSDVYASRDDAVARVEASVLDGILKALEAVK
ncbi:MAG: DUF4340 domain-containing protein [Vicinamibacterales bacterium]